EWPSSAPSQIQRASSAVRDITVTQSSERHEGMTPSVLKRPTVGFNPTMLLQPAGTRPEPAVSVPSAKVTSPAATATLDPELEPPEMYRGSNTLWHTPYGLRSPARPQAN